MLRSLGCGVRMRIIYKPGDTETRDRCKELFSAIQRVSASRRCRRRRASSHRQSARAPVYRAVSTFGNTDADTEGLRFCLHSAANRRRKETQRVLFVPLASNTHHRARARRLSVFSALQYTSSVSASCGTLSWHCWSPFDEEYSICVTHIFV